MASSSSSSSTNRTATKSIKECTPSAGTNETSRKRSLPDSPEVNSSEQCISVAPTATSTLNQDANWPRFLVVEPTDVGRPLSSLSPFIIEKAMKGLAGEVKSVKKLRSGVLLVEVTRAGQANNLLKQTLFASVPVRVSPHRSMNTSKGVIRNFELSQMNPDDLVADLQENGINVSAARNIMQTRDGQKRKTTSIILTFCTPCLPMSIKAGYLNIKVEPFIPSPLRCFNCQGFGHHQTTCKRSSICPKCSLASHGNEPCTAEAKCPNCSGNHPAYSASCPVWKREKDICRIKVTSNVSYQDARKLVDPPYVNNAARPSYASVTKTTRSVETQTDVVRCTCGALSAIEKVSKKQNKKVCVSAQTDEDDDNAMQDDMPWNEVRRSRKQSKSPQLNPVSKVAERRDETGKPPEKVLRGSQSPSKTHLRTKSTAQEDPRKFAQPTNRSGSQGSRTEVVEAAACLGDGQKWTGPLGSQERSKGPRKQIEPPT